MISHGYLPASPFACPAHRHSMLCCHRAPRSPLTTTQPHHRLLPLTLQDAFGAPVKPSFSALIAASATARSWPITSPLRALADEAVSKTGVRALPCKMLRCLHGGAAAPQA